MFTGIIESFGILKKIIKQEDNLILAFSSSITSLLKIDQSVAHNGICLTVTEIESDVYYVTAIKETIEKTSISMWQLNDLINLERAMILGSRLDGHIVQGHVDQIGQCIEKKYNNGSWYFRFAYDYSKNKNCTIEKGSITINGVSLTVIDSGVEEFGVAIIPYTYEHTNFHKIEVGTTVNLEFDVIGKYISKMKFIEELN